MFLTLIFINLYDILFYHSINFYDYVSDTKSVEGDYYDFKYDLKIYPFLYKNN